MAVREAEPVGSLQEVHEVGLDRATLRVVEVRARGHLAELHRPVEPEVLARQRRVVAAAALLDQERPALLQLGERRRMSALALGACALIGAGAIAGSLATAKSTEAEAPTGGVQTLLAPEP